MKTGDDWVTSSNVKIACYSLIILNSICIILGIAYLSIPTYSILWDIFGFILLFTLFESILLVYLQSTRITKRSNTRSRLNLLSYIYLVLIILSMIGMLLGNLLISSIYSNKLVANLGAYLSIYLSYFGILIFGIFFVLLELREYNNENLWLHKPLFNGTYIKRSPRANKILKKVVTIISRITFFFGILFAIVIVFGSFEVLTTFIAIIAAQFGVFFSIIFFANTILLLKLKQHKWSSKKYSRNVTIGFLVSGLLLVPVFSTNNTVNDIERNFSSAFGPNWQEKIPPNANQYFLETPFSLSNYFLGIPPKNSKIERNTLFYENEGIKLYFDAYMPLNNGEGLPGQNSTIIRIHGGSWTSGDKGMMNMMQMNKYFAAQGYIVYDIQYGLSSNPLFSLDPTTPSDKKGNFDIDDMMRHIGVFTNYLYNHSDEYGANIKSVFISGSSSGGQLAMAVALAISSGNYTHIFNKDLTIKGLIPFYPANGAMRFFGVSGRDEFKKPEKLIENDSPPCLIFQGTHDILNYFSIAENIRDTYNAKGNEKVAILWMPIGGHASDFYFPGYYNQIFLYYMERFLYLYH